MTAAILIAAVAYVGVVHARSAAASPFEDAVAAVQSGDHAEALTRLQPLADAGDARAQSLLGFMYFKGQGIPQDLVRAAAFYRSAAEQGNAEAAYNLGIMYHQGQGVQQNYGQAAAWFRRSAEAGRAAAAFNLGTLYHLGQGVPQDFAQALVWFRRAADQGHAAAAFSLGAMYANGQSVPSNRAEALRWFRVAEARGSQTAPVQIALLEAQPASMPNPSQPAEQRVAPAAAPGGEAPDGPLDGKTTLRAGPHVVAVATGADGSEILTLNGQRISAARSIPLIYLSRLPTATVIVFAESDLAASCEAPPVFLSIFPDQTYALDRSVAVNCREFDVDRVGDRLRITPFQQTAHYWSPGISAVSERDVQAQVGLRGRQSTQPGAMRPAQRVMERPGAVRPTAAERSAEYTQRWVPPPPAGTSPEDAERWRREALEGRARLETSTAAFDATRFLAQGNRDTQRAMMRDQITSMMVHAHYQDDAQFQARAEQLTEQALRPIWTQQDQALKDAAAFQQRVQASRYPETLGRLRQEHADRMRREAERLRTNVYAHLRTAAYSLDQDRERYAYQAAHADLKRANPEEAARRERLAMAQQRRAADSEARLMGWQVIHIAENVCQPLDDAFPGAKNPDEVLARVRARDPDAGYAPNAEWHQRDEKGNLVTMRWAAIETTNGVINLALSYSTCNGWIRTMTGR
jgi:hypothetical protein